MAHHKSAIKRIRQTAKRRLRNRHVRSSLRTIVKKLEQAITDQKPEEAKGLLAQTIPAIDKAASKGVIHRNKASRHVSRITRKVNKLVSA